MKIDLTNEEIKALKSILNKVIHYSKTWIWHEGNGEPDVPEGMVVEMRYKDGIIARGDSRDYIGWCWEECWKESEQIESYRFIEDDRLHD